MTNILDSKLLAGICASYIAVTQPFCHITTQVRKFIVTGTKHFVSIVQALKHFK
jgi:hypothetical protein